MMNSKDKHSEKEKEAEDVILAKELSDLLLNQCEEAYRKGINSVDIYKTLMQTPKQVFQKSENPNQKNQRKTKASKRGIWTYLVSFIGACSLTFIISYFSYQYTGFNPLIKIIPSLSDKICLLPSHPMIMEFARPIAACQFCSSPDKSPIIEFNNLPSKEEFLKVAYTSRPIIIRGGARDSDGHPLSINFQQLKDIFESEPKGVETVLEECQFLPFRSPFTSLRDAFNQIKDNSVWKEPWYIGWSNCHPGVAQILRRLFPRPIFLPEDSESSAIDWLFVGSPGLGAAMHIDYVRRPSWQAQLNGNKKWALKPPPECEEYCPESVNFTIYPGDLLFLETNSWYHQTFIEGNNLSISIGSEYD